jgi:hypothetical protein
MLDADSACDDTFTEGATSDAQRSWSRWTLFCQQVVITDALLINFEVKERYRLIGYFCRVMWEGSFSAD